MNRAFPIGMPRNDLSRAARSLCLCVQAAALAIMLALSVFVVKPTSHVVVADVHATFASSYSVPLMTVTTGEVCCAACPGHGWRAPDQVGAVSGPALASTDVVFALAETSAASLAIPPPLKPPRVDPRAADAG